MAFQAFFKQFSGDPLLKGTQRIFKLMLRLASSIVFCAAGPSYQELRSGNTKHGVPIGKTSFRPPQKRGDSVVRA
jgi:hypothetical protein